MRISGSSDTYIGTRPFPYMKQDDFLDADTAKAIQTEILSIPDSEWDRYENPFEKKYTLRNKYAFPPNLASLFSQLESPEFVAHVSAHCEKELITDPTRNFWGVHKYKSGDSLDIHLDAAYHPATKDRKYVTLGIYLSSNWKDEYGCDLEIWEGDSEKIIRKADSISPVFNRMVMFTNTEKAWHGNPVAAACPEDARRIFITMSYLTSPELSSNSVRTKALFVARPEDPVDLEKDRLRILRADAIRYKDMYIYTPANIIM